jgi:CRP-like cAMP-binding protein
MSTSQRQSKNAAASDARGWANVLAEVPLFAGLSRRHLKKVAELGKLRRFHDGMPIVRRGEPGDTLYVVLDGAVSVHRPGLSALSLGIGSFFGEIALLDGCARTATVTARGPVVCLAIAQSRFLKLLNGEPAIAVTLLRELATRLRTAQSTS